MTTLRDEAEALAFAMETNLVSHAELHAWVDLAISRPHTPQVILCELAQTSGMHPRDIAQALRTIPGEPSAEVVHRLLAMRLLHVLDGDATKGEVVAQALHHLWVAGALQPSLESVATWTAEALTLIDAGLIADSHDEVIETMRRELREATACEVA